MIFPVEFLVNNFNSYRDYELSLPDVTLVSAAGKNIEDSVSSLLVSAKSIEFGKVLLLTHLDSFSYFGKIGREFSFNKIRPLTSLGEYNKFLFSELYRYIETPYCLIVESDSFVINPLAWKHEFFTSDFIGAPWPSELILRCGNVKQGSINLDKNRVGNGGFSLRSQRLLKLTGSIKYDMINSSSKSDDLLIGYYLFDFLMSNGITYASIDIAKDFSIETVCIDPTHNLFKTFGFHGKKFLCTAESIVRQQILLSLSNRSSQTFGDTYRGSPNA